ncbi:MULTISPECIES: hypothetical protein [Cutibacterium]|jgi:hypothetical protein|uniref:Uncharacterized protein n=2 Tax=Cutibacterium acnes TaxID=1747 RepID=A0AAD0QLG8_CUTAC|nr:MULTISPECIES: hypothetical protein [Terrabacteria group]EGL43710.1 hypothetical protein HMPREF9948_1957 [Propionibacterium sp. 434-HC2]EGL46161.1 hypothetical protein HMPREF9947_0763 [Propionibacterium sp. 409-HC1]EGR91129.1 hypothetical protein HMPREF9949_2193 [Propionibacterium sp. CC003-HC2]ERS20463.1 hypothetical protein HMPREF1303_01401 [Propionibacterium sp. KPL2009]ERS21889.1 hypothetical protein HMPREF1302_01432 [Propionibacterium sp. KPL2008]ERS35369.1 hypothetical protein HMPREF1
MWWIWVLVFAGVLLVVEIVVGTIWLWRKLAAILGEVERVTGRLDELAHILEDVDTTMNKDMTAPEAP